MVTIPYSPGEVTDDSSRCDNLGRLAALAFANTRPSTVDPGIKDLVSVTVVTMATVTMHGYRDCIFSFLLDFPILPVLGFQRGDPRSPDSREGCIRCDDQPGLDG